MRLTTPSPFMVLCVLALLPLLGGCGIKPAQVDPPPGTSGSAFPRTYPDPATDPPPATPEDAR